MARARKSAQKRITLGDLAKDRNVLRKLAEKHPKVGPSCSVCRQRITEEHPEDIHRIDLSVLKKASK